MPVNDPIQIIDPVSILTDATIDINVFKDRAQETPQTGLGTKTVVATVRNPSSQSPTVLEFDYTVTFTDNEDGTTGTITITAAQHPEVGDGDLFVYVTPSGGSKELRGRGILTFVELVEE